MIPAHGGRLINRIAQGGQREQLLARAENAPRITLNERELCDLEMIGSGAMSPLEGFMSREDYDSVLARCRLANDVVWPLPVTLAAKGTVVAAGSDVALEDEDGNLLAIMHVEETYERDIEREAQDALGTTDEAHPGMGYLRSLQGPNVAGPVWVLNPVTHGFANDLRLSPRDTRVLFKARGWETVVAFQTRNPIHRAHEYLTKCALELVDGLLIHPLVGQTKSDDIPAEVRLSCYQELLARYYPPNRVVMSVYPQAMRYAGPREAVFHALLRKNYGCTHFIVGRDHAGVGNYYGTYDAQKIFERFSPKEIGITPLMFEHAFWDKIAGCMATAKTCAATDPSDKVFLSGTKVREMLKAGQRPPVEFTRSEVADILIDSMTSKAAV